MDIIANGDFAITNYNGQTWWTFRIPSNESIDFVQEIKDHAQTHVPKFTSPPPPWMQKARKKKGMQKKKRH